MAQLHHKTLGGASPRGKARVFFTCHPQDYQDNFEEITNDLLKHSNCAVYYYGEEPELNEEYYVNIERMQLMVMPVTTRLLYLPNRAMDVEFAFAMEHHIPVLLLMQEQGLEEKYAEKFGNLQFLDKWNRDLTAIPYEEKLKKYLDAVLLNDEMTAKIRAAFDAWIFLSYRKKDRKLAQDLMRLIHSDPRCQDIAIWYDEFLTIGEDFNDSIRKALEGSQLFVLAVTPNLLEAGNYVMREEYPEARNAGKPILPAEMEHTDREALKQNYRGIPEPLDPGADGMVTQAVLDALGALTVPENDEDPRHNFLIGLAYLSGLFVEKDHPRALRLVTQAAEAGLTEAMEKLVSMYETGEGVKRDYRASIQWREKLVEQVRLKYEQGSKEYTATYLNFLTYRLLDLGDAYYALGEVCSAKKAYEEASELTKIRLRKADREDIWRDLSICYDKLGRICLETGNYSGAKSFFGMGLEIARKLAEMTIAQKRSELEIIETHRSLADYYDTIGEICYDEADYLDARECFLRGMKIRLELAKYKTATVQRELADSYGWLGRVCCAEGDLPGGKTYFNKSMEINLKLVESGVVQGKSSLFFDYDCQGKICLDENDLAGAKQWYIKALKIAEEEQNGTIYALRDLNRCSYMLGVISEEQGDKVEARCWYTKAMEIAEIIAQTNTVDDCNNLAIVCFLLGNLENNISLMEKARDIWFGLAERCQTVPKYKEIALSTDQEIKKLQNNT